MRASIARPRSTRPTSALAPDDVCDGVLTAPHQPVGIRARFQPSNAKLDSHLFLVCGGERGVEQGETQRDGSHHREQRIECKRRLEGELGALVAA
jgi:hypothetical protein